MNRLPLLRVYKAMENIVAACRDSGVQQVIICPGSRNAPLTISFARSGLFSCHSVIDERSAAFIAMGMAIETKKPVVLHCTSGTAAANFYPAIIEAFYLRVPLLVLTADRPPELIDQWDGQTIHQEDLYSNHIKASWNLPAAYEDTAMFYQNTMEAAALAKSGIKGPVHLNVPLREPLYPDSEYNIEIPEPSPALETAEKKPYHPLPELELEGKRVLVIMGLQHETADEWQSGDWAVYADLMANDSPMDAVMEQVFMTNLFQKNTSLQPQVILSSGGPILSKPLKQYLRSLNGVEQYHFAENGDVADPFQMEPKLIQGSIRDFLDRFSDQIDPSYKGELEHIQNKVKAQHEAQFNESAFTEFQLVEEILNRLQSNDVLHLGNSMPVRYAAFVGSKSGRVYCNRGTSGIDGCVSTALGMASFSEANHFLLVGDVAFFYDSNALWNKLSKKKLKVVILNNGGGGIFQLIDGPSTQPEAKEYFVSENQRTAKGLCHDLVLPYYAAANLKELKATWETFKNDDGGVLELFTNKEDNQLFFKQYKEAIHGI